MRFAAFRSWVVSLACWETAALAVWCSVLLFVSVRTFVRPQEHTVYPIFSASADLWWSAADLYEPDRPADVPDGYRYSPTCSLLFTPFALFSDAIGGVLWRVVSVAAFLGALAWFVCSVLPASLSATHFAMIALLVVPMSVQSVNNGQTNLVVIACLLAAVASVREKRWNLASVLIALAFAIKVYPLALGLLLIVLYPRQLGWRLPLACAASLLTPFCFQDAGYVFAQYAKWIALLRAEDRSAIALDQMYRDVWLLIHLYGIPISRPAYLAMQVAAGVGIAALIYQRRRAGWATPRLLTATLALAAAWMMLLGPATEASSFALLAPSFAWSIVEAGQTKDRHVRHGLLWASCALFIVAIGLGGVSRDLTIHQCGVHVWASLCYFAYLAFEPKTTVAAAIPQMDDARLAS